MGENVSSRSDTSAGREATIILDYCNFSDHNSRNYKGLLKIVGNIFQPGMTNAQLLDRGGHGKQKPIPGPGSSSCVMVNLCSLNRNGYAVNLYI